MLKLSLVLTFGIVLGIEEQAGTSLNRAGSSENQNASHRIDAAKSADAIRSLFGERAAKLKVDVLSVCSCPMATGDIRFSIGDTIAPPLDQPARPVMWLGRSISETGKSYPIWVRASVVDSQIMVVAYRNLKYKQLLEANDILVSKVDISPLWRLGPQNVASYIGKLLMEPRAKGQVLTPASIAAPPAILSGDQVVVDVAGNGTHLSIKAEAQNSGNVGDSIFLFNPMNRRKFSAVVSGPGTARVVLGPIER